MHHPAVLSSAAGFVPILWTDREATGTVLHTNTRGGFMSFLLSPAGHGATLNVEGEVELDAIIMDGKTLSCGAVSSVKNIANPVTLARAVMDKVLYLIYIIYKNNN